MFRKTKIAAVTAVVLGLSSVAFAPAAQAVSLNENGGTGEVLLFPYYNVNNGFQTAFNIINTKDEYKAVKVRFRESKTSNDVLDFNLYLSPYDMFTMTLSKSASGGVTLSTEDNSCTFPTIKEPNEAIGTKDFIDIYKSVDNDILREGYLEVIEMGVISSKKSGPNPIKWTVKGKDVYLAENGIEHDQSGSNKGYPADCTLIRKAWDDGSFIQGGAESNADDLVGGIAGLTVDHTVNPEISVSTDMDTAQNIASMAGFYGQSPAELIAHGLTQPTGGLAGSSVLIDIPNVSGFVVEPTSIVEYSDEPQHYLPFDFNLYLLPSLASGSADTTVTLNDVFSDAASVRWPSVKRDYGLDDRNVAPNRHVPSGINPLPIAHAMAAVEVSNQYFLEPGQKTDWVITTPMRKHAIYNGFEYVPPGNFVVAGALPGDYMLVDSKNLAHDSLTIKQKLNNNGYWDHKHPSDVKATFVYWNREEGQDVPEDGDIVFSPPVQVVAPDSRLDFPNEVNIRSFSKKGDAASGSVLGSMNAQPVKTTFDKGWGMLTFSGFDLADARYKANWFEKDVAGNPRDEVVGDNNGNPIGVLGHAVGVPLTGFMSAIADINGGTAGETFPHIIERSRE